MYALRTFEQKILSKYLVLGENRYCRIPSEMLPIKHRMEIGKVVWSPIKYARNWPAATFIFPLGKMDLIWHKSDKEDK